MLGLKGQAEEPPQALRRSRTDNTLLLLGQLGIPQHEVRRAEAQDTALVAEGSERQGLDREERGGAAAAEAQKVDRQQQATAQAGGAREVPQQRTLSAEAAEEDAGERSTPIAADRTAARAGPAGGTTQQARTTAAEKSAETALVEAVEDAVETPEESVAGDAAPRSVAEEQAEGVEVGDDERNLHGPSDEDEYAHGVSDTPAHGDERGPRPPRARPGQRRLGVGLAPARPGPLAGWEQQGTPPRAPAVDACPSSQQHREAREEVEVERRAAEQADVDAQEEEVVLAASAADRRTRAGTCRQRALQERADDLAAAQQPRNTAARAATRGRGRGRGRGGRVGELVRAVAREKARSGNWRESHGRPEETGVEPMNEPAGEEGSEYMEEQEVESEDVSVEAEEGIPANREGGGRRGGRRGRDDREANAQVGESEA
ncbi:unnamed protein product [Closterium sp. Naga37s-1]|nr:unnamed protein product [Closterium sp. Naga37s-1]